jgi:hypothetical protein
VVHLLTLSDFIMPVTLTNNYKEIYSTETVEKIDELLEENIMKM